MARAVESWRLETPDRKILRALDGKRVETFADRVLSLSPRGTFSFATLLLRGMSAQDVADRIEYLFSLNCRVDETMGDDSILSLSAPAATAKVDGLPLDLPRWQGSGV